MSVFKDFPGLENLEKIPFKEFQGPARALKLTNVIWLYDEENTTTGTCHCHQDTLYCEHMEMMTAPHNDTYNYTIHILGKNNQFVNFRSKIWQKSKHLVRDGQHDIQLSVQFKTVFICSNLAILIFSCLISIIFCCCVRLFNRLTKSKVQGWSLAIWHIKYVKCIQCHCELSLSSNLRANCTLFNATVDTS